MTPLAFRPPDASSWVFDRSHQNLPVPRLVQQALASGYRDGFANGFAEVGALLETIELSVINGWCYTAVRPVGAPPGAAGPPPFPIFWLLTRLHPAIRQRNRTASSVFDARPWVQLVEEWEQHGAPEWQSRLEALQAREPAGLDEAGIVALVRELLESFEAITRVHFRQGAHGSLAGGDLLAHAEDLGIPVALVFRALVGASPETARPRALAARVADLTSEAGLSLDGDAEAVLDRLRDHEATSESLDAYLSEYGWRTADDDMFMGRTLVEQPSLVVATLKSASRSGSESDDSSNEARAALLARAPSTARDLLERQLHDAVLTGNLREHTCSLMFWHSGLVRRALLELGSRLIAEGRVPDRLALYHLTPEELGAIPPRETLEARDAEFSCWAAATPPDALNEPGAPPPIDWLPPVQRRLQRAVDAFVGRFHPDPDREEAVPLQGLVASPGTVEGRAHQLDRGLDGLGVGDILVARSTTPALNSVLPSVGGLVTEYGGLVCHAAIVSRELGFPGIVGCHEAVTRIPHGAWIRVDGSTGTVEILAEQASRTSEPVDLGSFVPVAAELPSGPGVWVSLRDATDPARFGGKASQLAHATAAGHPVPQGLALDTELVQGIAAGSAPHLATLADALARFEGAVAVRSSAPDEDGRSASFAGLHHTELGVHGATGVAAAVCRVWESAQGPGARAYRERLGIEASPEMAVIIQEMVPAQCAGVRFGRDPVTGDDVRVIEGAPGLGVSVVDGRVRPDRVRLDPTGSRLEEVPGEKPFRVVLGDEGVQEESLTDEEAVTTTLDTATVDAVHALGEACDALFSGPQDVEWAAAGGTVWLLQSRPVTTGGCHA